ncbi:MAG: hypothetical protein JWQ68_2550 [Cryobacterium sp.]|jgi:hypothetical protein|nr:hypothetical protein [Cryobacterium sp.]
MSDKPNPIQIQKFLGGIDYPAEKSDLVENAEKAGADENVMNVLRGLPDRSYDAPTAVSEAISDGG